MRINGCLPIGRRLLMLTFVVLLLVGVGCAGVLEQQPSGEQTGEPAGEAKGPVPIYYDFGDVLVPGELSLDRKNSFVYSAAAFTAGVLVLEGFVEATSLVDFFTANMAKDGWVLKSSFRYRRVILNFEKDNRSCLVNIAEFPLKTQVEIWVAPQANATYP